MSDDIVARLRHPPFGTETSERNIMSSAADEIERLRAELAAERERADEERRLKLEAASFRAMAHVRADRAVSDRDAVLSERDALRAETVSVTKMAEQISAQNGELIQENETLRALLRDARERLGEAKQELEIYCEDTQNEDYNSPRLNETLARIDRALKGDGGE